MIVKIGTQEAEEIYKIPDGYVASGRQIVPVRDGPEIPTVVGYLMRNGIVVRSSLNPTETQQIEVFERRAREGGLPIIASM